MLEVGKTRHLLLGTKVENHQARKATLALKGNTHSKKVGAGWGDEGSAIHEDRRMDHSGGGGMSRDHKQWKHPSSAFCATHQKEEKGWKHQGWIHLKDTDLEKPFQ